MHAHAGAVRPGGPRVKGSETVYCTHCFKNGSDRETAKSVKRNLSRHNKRCHSELDPVKDQAWMLVWTGGSGGSGSANPQKSFVNFLQASPPEHLHSGVPKQIPAVGIPSQISQAQLSSSADASVADNLDPEVPAQGVNVPVPAVLALAPVPVTPIQMVATLAPRSSFPRSSFNAGVASAQETSGKRKLSQNQSRTIVGAFGAIAHLNRSVDKIHQELISAHSRLNDDEKVEVSGIFDNFSACLRNIDKLRIEFEQVQMRKKIKLEQMERIASKLVVGLKEKDELVRSLKVEHEKNNEIQRPGSSSRVISQSKISQVPAEFRVVIKRCLEKHSKLELVNGILECTCCRDD